jgi:hypothetical protein
VSRRFAGCLGLALERLPAGLREGGLTARVARLLVEAFGVGHALPGLVIRLAHDLALDDDLGREAGVKTPGGGIATLAQRRLGLCIGRHLLGEFPDLGVQFVQADESWHQAPRCDVVGPSLALLALDPGSFLAFGGSERSRCQAVFPDLGVEDPFVTSKLVNS